MVSVHIWHDSAILSRIENAAMDFMINWTQGVISSEEETIPFVFIDIDEKTYRKWGEPATVPKDKLAKMLEFARSGDPILIVADVDTSERSAIYSDQALERTQLVDSLTKWADDEGGISSPNNPTVLFVRSFRKSPAEDAEYPELRKSILDHLLVENENFHSVSPLFERSLYDYTVRHWRLFEPTCNEGVGNVVPSVQLITAARIYLGDLDLSKVYRALDLYRPDSCDSELDTPQQSLVLGGRRLSLLGDRLNDRIIYKVPWANGSFSQSQIDMISYDNQQMPLATHLSARLIVDSESELDPSLLEGRIVVIGSSFVENRDSYLTPIGVMPGAVVLINAIHSLLQYGQMGRPSVWLLLGLEFVLILGVSILFSIMGTYLAKIVSGVVVLVVLLPLTFSMFKYGLWLDFALPLLGVQLHELVAKVKSSAMIERS